MNETISRTAEFKCENCGTTWVDSISRRQRFCSKLCLKEHTRKNATRICAHCGKSFVKDANSAGKYCSRGCYRNDINTRVRRARDVRPIEVARLQRKTESEKRKSDDMLRSVKELRHNTAIRLWLFMRHRSVKHVAAELGERQRTTTAHLFRSSAYCRYADKHGSWRSKELRLGFTSRKFRVESEFCNALEHAILSSGNKVSRESSVIGRTDRRIDMTATSGLGIYGIEAKHVNHPKKADQCLGQVLVKSKLMGWIPVCAFPSDCMPDEQFISVCNRLGVIVVNEETICNELFTRI